MHKNFRTLALALFAFYGNCAFSQNITLTIKDYQTKQPIQNALIYAKKKTIGKSNDIGKVEVSSEYRSIKIFAIGYDSLEMSLGSMSQTVYLSTRQLKIKEVKIKPIIDVFANNQIKRLLDNFERLHPNSSENYRFQVYSKLVIDVSDDSASKIAFKSDTEFNEWIKKSKLFVWEKLTDVKHNKSFGQKKTVLNSNMSGIKIPIYELIALTLDDYNYLPRIFRDNNHKEYTFRLDDSLVLQDRKTYEINFFPQRKYKGRRSRSGFVYIDSATGALIKYYGHTKDGYAEIENQLINGFCFNKSIFYKGNNMSMGAVSASGGGEVVIENRLKLVDINMNNNFIAKEFRGNETDISFSLNDNASFDLLKKARGIDTMDAREANTFNSLDSIISRENGVQKIKLVLALMKGYVKFGKVNLSINDLFRYNQHEGFRINLGGETNYDFHKRIYLGGYIGIGFKDDAVKFGGNIRYVLDHYTQMQLILSAHKDVQATGRPMHELERSFSKMNYYSNLIFAQNFFQSEQLSLGMQHDVNRHLVQRTSANVSRVNPLYSYAFRGDSQRNLTLFSVGTSLYWYPNSHFVTTSEGKFPVERKATDVYMSYRYFHPTNKNQPGFHVANIEFLSSIKNPLGKTNFTMKGGYSSADAPLMFLQEGLGASQRNNETWSSFGLTSYRNFATMQPGTFYSNYHGSLFLRHLFPGLRVGKSKVLTPALCYNTILGGLENASDHSPHLQAPTKLYQEAGLEVRNLLTPLGLGIYYRLGAYSQDGIGNNLAFRLVIGLD